MYNLLNIKEIAANKNISIKKLIVRIGISEPGFYKSLENNSMNIKTLSKIAEVLQVSISELINDRVKSELEKELKKNEVVASPVEVYGPENNMAKLYKVMFEQQVEISNQQKEITELTRECEMLKNASAPAKDALAG